MDNLEGPRLLMNNRSPPLASTWAVWGQAHPRRQIPDPQQPQGPVRNLVSYFNSMPHTSPLASVPMDANTGARPRFVDTELVRWVTELGLLAEQIPRIEWSDMAPQDPQLAERLSDMEQVVQQLQGLGSDLVRATGEIRTQLEHCHGQTQTVGGIVKECVKALDDHTTNLRQAATAREHLQAAGLALESTVAQVKATPRLRRIVLCTQLVNLRSG